MCGASNSDDERHTDGDRVSLVHERSVTALLPWHAPATQNSGAAANATFPQPGTPERFLRPRADPMLQLFPHLSRFRCGWRASKTKNSDSHGMRTCGDSVTNIMKHRLALLRRAPVQDGFV